jgi:hypothetical protein
MYGYFSMLILNSTTTYADCQQIIKYLINAFLKKSETKRKGQEKKTSFLKRKHMKFFMLILNLLTTLTNYYSLAW